MTQTPTRPTTLQRTRALIQIPNAQEPLTNPNQKSLPGTNSGADNNQKALLIHPGEEREIWIKVDNNFAQPLQWSIEITGDFPIEWCIGCIWRPDIKQTIQPHDNTSTKLCLQIPADFFEKQDILENKHKLLLNYQGQIYVYATWQGEKKLIGYQHFHLFIRPDTSYLTLLPEIYHQSDFLNRLLMIFEQGYDPSVQTLANLWAYLDPLTAPSSLLPFLAKWVAWENNPRWDLKKQRRLIKNAVELYRWRGSKLGLRLYIHLFTDLPLDDELDKNGNEKTPEAEKHISIEESFSPGFVIGSASFKDNFNDNPNLGGGKLFHFKVTLHPTNREDIDEELVREVIELFKPAFCSYDLQILPRNYLRN